MLAREILDQLREYTIEVTQDILNIKPEGTGKNNNGTYIHGQPTGAITHYTASNESKSKNRPLGRIPVLLQRFRPKSNQKIGVHFIIWDQKEPELDKIREKYPALVNMPGEVFFMGDKLAYWQAGWFNNFSYGVEIRNLGRLKAISPGSFQWGPHIRYRGRPPIKIGSGYWEPYSHQQMAATLQVHRIMRELNPTLRPERFLGHVHVSSTRIDPGPHFPIHEMRDYVFFKHDTPLYKVEFLDEFLVNENTGPIISDPYISESSLQQGKYRNDWDGCPNSVKFMKELPTDMRQYRASQSGDIVKDVKTILQRIGYFIEDVNSSELTPEFVDTVKIFQARWKMKSSSGKFIGVMSPTGKLDRETIRRIRMMDNQMKRL